MLIRNLFVLFCLLFFCLSVQAEEGFETKHKLVIQVSSGDPALHTLVLNNAAKIQKHYGMDNIQIEVVAYGPGLSILTKKNKEPARVKSLAQQNIVFSACGNTIKAIKAKTGKEPALLEGVRVVPAGLGRIIELQEAGYSYVRP